MENLEKKRGRPKKNVLINNNDVRIIINDIPKNTFINNFTNNFINNCDNINRIDLTHLEVISIDPPNCTDVDDAFSIWSENNKGRGRRA